MSSYLYMLAPALLALAIFPASVLGATKEEITAAMQRDLKMRPEQVKAYFSIEKKVHDRIHRYRNFLGESYAGSWMEQDAQGNFQWVVSTSDAYKHQKMLGKADGPKIVKRRYSMKELGEYQQRLQTTLAGYAKGGGIQALGISEKDGAIVIFAKSSERHTVNNIIASVFGDPSMVKITWVEHELAQELLGAERIPGGGGKCSVGFNANRGNDRGFITAGHCYTAGTTIRVGGNIARGDPGTPVAVVDFSSHTSIEPPIPDAYGMDAAWVRHLTSEPNPPQVQRYGNQGALSIVGQMPVLEGSAICRSGSATGPFIGTVCGWAGPTNLTVGWGTPTQYNNMGLTYGICSAEGDSGGAVFTPSGEAQGIHSTNLSARIRDGQFFDSIYGPPLHSCHLGAAAVGAYTPISQATQRWNANLQTVTTCGRLNPGESVRWGVPLQSCNGQWQLVIGADGWMRVLFYGQPTYNWAQWVGPGGRTTILQTGAIMSYTWHQWPIWTNGVTASRGGTLFLTNGGDLVVRNHLDGAVTWVMCSSSTHPESMCYEGAGYAGP
jgi:hypothetical protein